MKSNWLISKKFPEGFGDNWEYPELILQLFWNRGIKSRDAAEEFLKPNYSKLYDPFLFPDMKKTVERIVRARDKGETVFVFTDYDADGVPGGVILYTILRAMGLTPKIYIPHREKEGYGLNMAAIDYMKAEGATLFITCDLGISNNKEVAYAASLGLDVIITDHHSLPPELTGDAYAIIHPEVGDYPFKKLSGGGVAFKLAQGLLKTIGSLASYSNEAHEKWLLDLAAITTVADMMSLIGENRILVKYGLKVLNKTRRLGLRKLIETAGLEFGGLDAHNIGFQIAPRINAAGRMDHANAAFELLISEDETEATRLAKNLNKANSDRQRQTEIIVNEAKFKIVEAGKEKDCCLFVFKSEWPLGLLGLAAGKISDTFNRPVFLMTEIAGKIKGSARSNEGGFNIMVALQKSAEMLDAFGGHAAAAGMTLKDNEGLEIFKEKILDSARAEFKEKERVLSIDAETQIDEVNLKFCEELEKFAPFGRDNPEPVFLSRDLEVRKTEIVGNGTKHLRLMVSGEKGVQYKMMGFCQAHWCEVLKFGDKINAVYELGVNEWNGRREVQMKIVDIERLA